MQIDWITVAAQIVNFLVLVWLLQRFLYRPIAQAMRRREDRIEERLAEARSARQQAEHEAEGLRQERRDLEKARDGILDEARTEAAALREQLDAKLHEEVEEKRATWRRHLREERDDFARRLQRRAGHQLLDIAARVLDEFAGQDLAEAATDAFLARIGTLDAEARERLAEAAKRAEEALVETGRPLTPAQRGRITRALHESFSTEIPVAYREAEEVLLGARLTIGEQTLEWSAARHLKRLERALDEILDSEARQPLVVTRRSEETEHASA